MSPVPTTDDAVRQLMTVRGRVAPGDLRLTGTTLALTHVIGDARGAPYGLSFVGALCRRSLGGPLHPIAGRAGLHSWREDRAHGAKTSADGGAMDERRAALAVAFEQAVQPPPGHPVDDRGRCGRCCLTIRPSA